MRNRGSAILVKDNQVVLIKRVRGELTYFVFPGGGIEEGETPEEATKREALEELGVNIEVKECFAEVVYNGTQYFFLCDIIDGTIGNGQGEEYSNASMELGTYQPIWVDINKLRIIEVRPKEVADKLLSIQLKGQVEE
ncbi:NUDIX hydrolase [Bacillus sp. EB01]|uniref:NUDIX hydrolase n=1 Tax=Bacillus sp. EB01 TaxID=1347086 RepID=UPI0005C5C0F1|nr:NUDIX domain-containing protein [Bacillus sp. EB01]